MSQKLLANRSESTPPPPPPEPSPAFVLFRSSFFFSSLSASSTEKRFHIKQQMWPNPKKGFSSWKKKTDREKKQKLRVTQRRFACYVCCEALGIKHLKIHEEHFKEPKRSFTVGKIKKWAVFNPPTVTWLLKAQRGEMSHDLSLHLPHVNICMKLNETKSKSCWKSNRFFSSFLWWISLWISSAK